MEEVTQVIVTAELQGREVVIGGIFDAMRARVQDVHQSKSDTATVGPKEYSIEPRDGRQIGGVWRYVQRGPDGHEFAFKGVQQRNTTQASSEYF